VLYAAVAYTLLRSTDAAASWQEIARAPGQGLISGLLASPGGALYASTSSSGVYTSPDGLVWTPLNGGLGSLSVNDLRLGGGILYAATENGGVEALAGLPEP
jgi:hypothetical protein